MLNLVAEKPVTGPQQETETATDRKRLLVVDDDCDGRRTLVRVLRSFGHHVETARDGIEGIAKLDLDIDLVLLDAAMPGMDGYAVAEWIRDDDAYGDLPIIMVTGLNGREDRLRAVEVGVNDFISKPFDITELRLRSTWLLKMKETTDALKLHRAELEEMVAERTAALRRALEETATAHRDTKAAHLDTIRRLVLAAEYKNSNTATHIERIGLYCECLGRKLLLSPGDVEVLRHASPMHDVGKLGIPDAILVKPGKLTLEEWEVMKEHTIIGAHILHGSPSDLLRAGAVIALCHHERWDGTGYPRGLAGEEIPLFARICAVADYFDAVTTNRAYRKAFPNHTAYEMMAAARGTHFDPNLLDVFMNHRAEIETVQAAHRARAARTEVAAERDRPTANCGAHGECTNEDLRLSSGSLSGERR